MKSKYVKEKKHKFIQQNVLIMESLSLEGFIIQAFARGMVDGSMANGTTNAVIEVTSENTALPETQVVPKRKRYSVPKNDECIRLVGEHTEKLAKDDDGTCILCCDNKVEVELIHSVCKGGDGKEHNCFNNRFCKSCIMKSIAAQESRKNVILPQCPCCRGRVAKMVQLDNNVVLDLPPFKPEKPGAIVDNARRNRLVFSYNGTGLGPGETGNINVAKKLIRDAKEAGANAAKFQIFQPCTLGRDVKKKNTASSIWKKLYSSDSQILALVKFCKRLKIDFLCSVFDQQSLERVKKYKSILNVFLRN